MADFIFDTETSGLPVRSGYTFPCYKNLEAYDSARIVSISWIVSQNHKPIAQAYYIVKPVGFVIGEESIQIHGISNEKALAEGLDIVRIFKELRAALEMCHNIVAHNVKFDVSVLKSELYRCIVSTGDVDCKAMFEVLDKLNTICTMNKGKEIMGTRKYPKLAELYKYIYNQDIQNAHNAQYDTYYCYQCFKHMFPIDKSIFFFGNKTVRLTAAQTNIVYEDFGKNILVIACAGSGKTVSMICRIKNMLDSGIDDKSIMLTTFTRDAAADMKNKLHDIMGYTTGITIGTIDSISKYFVDRFEHSSKMKLKDVTEYNYLFLKAIRDNPGIIKQYKYMFIDEFQDINDVQYEIIKEFSKQGSTIFCVGDDAQNIYTFRGSKVDYILNFEKLFDSSKTMYLVQNFRSCKEVIDLANASIEKSENSVPKIMVQGNFDISGTRPYVEYCRSAASQNKQVVQRILSLISDGVAEHDIVVLSPINQPLYMIEELLTKHNVKNVYLDGKSDVKTRKKPWHVCLCTIHKSKGLEWDHVIMMNVSDELLPKIKTPSNIEESRRLFYVGITRARKSLHIYYTVVVTNEPFVSRYVSEVDRRLYDYDSVKMPGKCFSGVSLLEASYVELAVTKLIERLDGKDYITLKELGIIPSIDVNTIDKQTIYEGFTYLPFIEKDDLYSDFGNFIETLIMIELAEATGMHSIVNDTACLRCLANVKLDSTLYVIFCQYKNNFKNNVRCIGSLMEDIYGNQSGIIRVLEENSKLINSSHISSVLNILEKIQEKAKYYKIEPHEVPVFSKSFLPEGFEIMMEDALNCYKRLRGKKTKEDLEKVFQVSKCTKIALEYRRRLLYKQISMDDLMLYEDLFDKIRTKLIPFISGLCVTPGDVSAHQELSIKDGMYGTFDLRVGNTVINYKTSSNDDISLQLIVQLLCYKVLCDFNGVPIDTVAILNPLRGWYASLDVSSWNKHQEFVSYVIASSKKAC